jgi:uncharacterized damage-inducible protein DinB
VSIANTLLPEFDREMGLTRRLLSRVPDERFEWQPHVRSMTLGRLAEHLAELPQWVVITIDQDGIEMTAKPPDHRPPATCADVLALFDRASAAGRAALSGKTDAELMAPWTLRRDGKELFTMPKAAVLRNFVFNHMVHHRGQLTVYLRLHDIPLPSIYGPSADEAM